MHHSVLPPGKRNDSKIRIIAYKGTYCMYFLKWFNTRPATRQVKVDTGVKHCMSVAE